MLKGFLFSFTSFCWNTQSVHIVGFPAGRARSRRFSSGAPCPSVFPSSRSLWFMKITSPKPPPPPQAAWNRGRASFMQSSHCHSLLKQQGYSIVEGTTNRITTPSKAANPNQWTTISPGHKSEWKLWKPLNRPARVWAAAKPTWVNGAMLIQKIRVQPVNAGPQSRPCNTCWDAHFSK